MKPVRVVGGVLMFSIPVCSAPLAGLIILVSHPPVFLILGEILSFNLNRLNPELLRDNRNNDRDPFNFLVGDFLFWFLNFNVDILVVDNPLEKIKVLKLQWII